MQRYKAERNELKVDRQRLEKLLANLVGERNDLAQNLQRKEFENTKLIERNQNLETRDKNELLEEQKNNRKLVKDNESLKEKIFEIENKSKSAKRHVYGQEDEGFTDLNMWKTNTSSLPERYSLGGGKSDTEKENISLRNELTEALKKYRKNKTRIWLNKSKEDHKKLQRGQDELQGNLREKSNELRGSETQIRKLEADILFLQNTKTENDQLKESLREIEGVKREFENLEKRCHKETSDRMSSGNISTKYKEDNDRLRKERNDARTELQRVLKGRRIFISKPKYREGSC
ncbi:unnamed protein product [Mytilus edulis]|uniref:Uncharacterized protein n=1 Tax=Mytilus edulis TaxID=6550 RepID=A0A8S3R0N1_MYTED|nr:unnamed protein product [Mytilus edulis]